MPSTVDRRTRHRAGTILQALRQTRVREYLDHLRKTASIKDRRKELQSANRQAAS